MMLEGTQTQDDHGLDAWREQVERAFNLRGEYRSLSQRVDEPYGDYLESLSFYYGENVRAAEKLPPKGSKWLLIAGCSEVDLGSLAQSNAALKVSPIFPQGSW